MDRYEKENAILLIEGYFLRSPTKNPEHSFQKAKEETLANLLGSIRNVQEITSDMFFEEVKV